MKNKKKVLREKTSWRIRHMKKMASESVEQKLQRKRRANLLSKVRYYKRKAAREPFENITLNDKIKKILEQIDNVEGPPDEELYYPADEESPVDPLRLDGDSELEEEEIMEKPEENFSRINYQPFKALVRPISIQQMRIKYREENKDIRRSNEPIVIVLD